MNDRSKDRRIPLGILGKPFGVKGYIFLRYYGDNQENIKDFDELYIDEWHSLKIEDILISNKKLSVKLKGIEDRSKAETLRNKEVYVLESHLPPLREGEYYWHQLEGLDVFTTEDECLGKVHHLIETGSNDVLVVRATDASIDQRERLIPYLPDDVVREVDLSAGRLVVDWDPEF